MRRSPASATRLAEVKVVPLVGNCCPRLSPAFDPLQVEFAVELPGLVSAAALVFSQPHGTSRRRHARTDEPAPSV